MNSEKLIDYGKRWALLALGMFVAASGISLITQTHLGTTPISSLPYTITGLTGLTFGTTTFIVNVVFFVIEWLLLKKRGVFHAFMCFQVPVVFVFSAFIDFTMTPAAAVMPSGYIPRFIVSFLGNAILALGIVMQIHSRTIVQPGEGIVLAESVFFRHPFGTIHESRERLVACDHRVHRGSHLHRRHHRGPRGNVCLGALRRAFRETVPETLADAEGPGTSGRGRKGDGVKRKSSEAPSVKA